MFCCFKADDLGRKRRSIRLLSERTFSVSCPSRLARQGGCFRLKRTEFRNGPNRLPTSEASPVSVACTAYRFARKRVTLKSQFETSRNQKHLAIMEFKKKQIRHLVYSFRIRWAVRMLEAEVKFDRIRSKFNFGDSSVFRFQQMKGFSVR